MLPLLSRELAVVVHIDGVEDRAHLVGVRVRVRVRVRLRVRVRVRVWGQGQGQGWASDRARARDRVAVREDRADRGLGVGGLLQVRLPPEVPPQVQARGATTGASQSGLGACGPHASVRC